MGVESRLDHRRALALYFRAQILGLVAAADRVGIIIAIAGLLTVVIVGVVHPARREIAATAAVVDIFLLFGWLFMFTPDWIRVPADAYAERLLEVCEKL